VILENYITQLVHEMELEGSLASQVPGVFAFPLEEGLNILITNHPPGFILSCNIAPMPKQPTEEFLTRLMLGNLFGQGTKGAVLGINEDGSLLTLTHAIDYNAEYKEFRDILEDFTNSVDLWCEEAQRVK
jgi:Tir chaperone protein (CesT) family